MCRHTWSNTHLSVGVFQSVSLHESMQTSFLGGMKILNGGFWLCEGPGLTRISGLLVDNLIMLGKRFSVDFDTYQPLTSQHSPVILCLDSSRGLPPF